MLLSMIGKILSRVILDKLKGALDAMLREELAGFRNGRSCTDQVATLRIIVEQSVEWQSSVTLQKPLTVSTETSFVSYSVTMEY